MNKWEAQFANFGSMLKELGVSREQGGNLRFSRSAVVVSDVAGQFYCEKKVEMQYRFGKVETPAMSVGTKAH
jgi:hypothetical protein